MGELIRNLAEDTILEELTAMGLHDRGRPEGYAVYVHTGGDHERDLSIIHSLETYDMWQAHAYHFGVRRWRHVSVSVIGQLAIRLKDQKAIGRQRGPGERSPAPLPDWYDLTHIAYGHWNELGFLRDQPVFQILPPPDADYLNIAEALHLRQPA